MLGAVPDRKTHFFWSDCDNATYSQEVPSNFGNEGGSWGHLKRSREICVHPRQGLTPASCARPGAEAGRSEAERQRSVSCLLPGAASTWWYAELFRWAELAGNWSSPSPNPRWSSGKILEGELLDRLICGINNGWVLKSSVAGRNLTWPRQKQEWEQQEKEHSINKGQSSRKGLSTWDVLSSKFEISCVWSIRIINTQAFEDICQSFKMLRLKPRREEGSRWLSILMENVKTKAGPSLLLNKSEPLYLYKKPCQSYRCYCYFSQIEMSTNYN